MTFVVIIRTQNHSSILRCNFYITNFLYLHNGQTIYFQGFVNLHPYSGVASIRLGKRINYCPPFVKKQQFNRYRQATAAGRKKG